jgi:ACT domain-containing protein
MDKGSISNCYYDLLASESRQASFIAVAKGQVDPGHWFKLGRTMGIYGGSRGLVSWSGTMFEYFMPLLIMKSFTNTLLNESCRAVVREQMDYAKGKSGFWGISESAFYKFDIGMNYQYKAFGVPNTALSRSQTLELVLSPYSSMLAMMINLKGSLLNIESMVKEGLEGRYGFYEAVDYTSSRIGKGKEKALIKSYMVHHQGMGLMSIQNVLKAGVLQERFHSIPEIKATELLLQEKLPKTAVYKRKDRYEPVNRPVEEYKIIPRIFKGMDFASPKVHLLSMVNFQL